MRQPFDIYSAWLHDENGEEIHSRVLMLTGNTVCRLSSPIPESYVITSRDYEIMRWKEAGLSYPTLAHVDQLVDVPQEDFESFLGVLDPLDISFIIKMLIQK